MNKCVVLNAGLEAWAFESLARDLAKNLDIEVSETPKHYNYILSWNERSIENCNKSFIPFAGIKLASDKRLLAKIFKANKIPIPDTYLLKNRQDVLRFIDNNFGYWCLKYPSSCGASGHRIINCIEDIPQDWPKPYVVQRFIYLDEPMVYRIYCAGQKLFGWNVRKFPQKKTKNPWVAHARGAIYEILEEIPDRAIEIATKTLQVTHLFNSFGCVDLIRDNNGNWLVLEVGTDGIFNHVDRNIGDANLERELAENIKRAFWQNAP